MEVIMKKKNKSMDKKEVRRKKLLLLILEVNLKMLQHKEVTATENRDFVLALNELGLTLGSALKQASGILK